MAVPASVKDKSEDQIYVTCELCMIFNGCWACHLQELINLNLLHLTHI
jgi:hypothetical protein